MPRQIFREIKVFSGGLQRISCFSQAEPFSYGNKVHFKLNQLHPRRYIFFFKCISLCLESALLWHFRTPSNRDIWKRSVDVSVWQLLSFYQLQTLLTLLSMLADVVMSYQPYMEHWFWFKYADLPWSTSANLYVLMWKERQQNWEYPCMYVVLPDWRLHKSANAFGEWTYRFIFVNQCLKFASMW